MNEKNVGQKLKRQTLAIWLNGTVNLTLIEIDPSKGDIDISITGNVSTKAEISYVANQAPRGNRRAENG